MKKLLQLGILLTLSLPACGQFGPYQSSAALARHGVPTAAVPVDSPGAGIYSGAQSITITTATSGAAICYTVDGSTPKATTPGTCSHGTTYSGAFTSPSSTFTLKAIATKAAFINSGFRTSVYTINPTAATPVDSPGTGIYAGAQTITITTATSGARICYTVDGSTPTATTPGTCSHGTSYVSGFTSPSSTFTLKALATKSGFFNSSVDTSTYTINPTAATPVDSPGTGTYPGAQSVTITTSTSGATICYTLDGSTPAASTPGTCSAGTTYGGAFTSPSSTFTLKSLATKTSFINSAVKTSIYTINATAATPVDSPGTGTYAGAQTVTITTSTSGAAICYTVDGSTPAASTPGTCSHGTTYSGAFTSPSSTFTLKALATKTGFINSSVDTSTYTINPTAATPMDSPGAGTYGGAQTITITTATSGATICYTIDGSTPAAATAGTCSHGTTYAGAFTSPSSTFTLKALATKIGFINSGIDTSVYTLPPTAATPVDSPGAGTYASAQTITITTATSGAAICYTTDGSTPTATVPGTCSHGTTYSGTFTSPSISFTLNSIATKAGFLNSGLKSSGYVIGTIIPAASCNRSDVLSAMNSIAADGVTVSIPPCPAGVAWTSPITYTQTNSFILLGAGALYSVAGGTGTAGSDQTVIINNTSAGAMIVINTISGKSFRFTGIALRENASSPVSSSGVLQVAGTSTSVRVDHCHFFSNIGGSSSLHFNGSVQGVTDHDFFEALSGILNNHIGFQNGQGWNGASSGDWGDNSWATAENWGTSQFMFVEDCRFYNGDTGDTVFGARFVLRHCTITGDGASSQQMFWHGATAGRERGGRAAEVYGNIFTQAGNYGSPPVSLNSGTVLAWGNTVTGGYKSLLQISYDFRTTAGGGGAYHYLPSPNGWGFCGPAAGGPTFWDSNLNSSGYACLDQPGRGAGQLLNGLNFPGTLNTATGTIAWPHELLSPMYVWGNTYTPMFYTSIDIVTENSGGSDGSIVSNNREWFMQFGPLANPGSFNGTVGIGQGLRSARPSNCTGGTDPATSSAAPGVGYWATDEQILYVCNPTNTWTDYYEPYLYPHPLNH